MIVNNDFNIITKQNTVSRFVPEYSQVMLINSGAIQFHCKLDGGEGAEISVNEYPRTTTKFRNFPQNESMY